MHEEYNYKRKNPACRNLCMGGAEDSFSINLFLNLHTVKLRAGIKSDTKEKIGWRLFVFYACYGPFWMMWSLTWQVTIVNSVHLIFPSNLLNGRGIWKFIMQTLDFAYFCQNSFRGSRISRTFYDVCRVLGVLEIHLAVSSQLPEGFSLLHHI